jgi:hypothetical protein
MSSIVNHFAQVYAKQQISLEASTDKELFTAYLHQFGITWTWLVDTAYNFFQEASKKALLKALENAQSKPVDIQSMTWTIKSSSLEEDKALVSEILNFPGTFRQFQMVAGLDTKQEYRMDLIWEYIIGVRDHDRVCKEFLSKNPLWQLSQFSDDELDILFRYLKEPTKWINELSPKMLSFLANNSIERLLGQVNSCEVQNPKLQKIVSHFRGLDYKDNAITLESKPNPLGKLTPEQARILQEKYLAPMHRLYDFNQNSPDEAAKTKYARENKADLLNLLAFLTRQCAEGSVEKEFQDLLKENFPQAVETVTIPAKSFIETS